jgi:hypothetical protein
VAVRIGQTDAMTIFILIPGADVPHGCIVSNHYVPNRGWLGNPAMFEPELPCSSVYSSACLRAFALSRPPMVAKTRLPRAARSLV